MQPDDLLPERLLRLPDVMEQTGLSRSRLYSLMAAKEFPQPMKEGASSLWPQSCVQRWIDRRIAIGYGGEFDGNAFGRCGIYAAT